MANTEREKEDLLALRKKIFILGYKGGMAHLASCYSSLETIYALYLKGILRYDPENPRWKDRDRFILSKGHAGLALYTVMMKAGLIEEKVLDTYLQEESLIGGEPCMRDSAWVEATTGSLGHGLSMGLGIAMALKMDHSPAKVYVMLGDGECEEGTVWEAVMMAPAFGLDNLVAILDCNEIQKMDFVKKTIGETRWAQRWEAFGWEVKEIDGHDMEDFKRAVEEPVTSDKPRLVIAHTVKGKGISIMENNPNWHFKLPGRKELKVFKEELGISDSELER
ncbi:transketolase [Lachnospiraceae bacterium OM04-12BH]|nr:transketolase [Lachnospiraceae bacterium OM04-12BH]